MKIKVYLAFTFFAFLSFFQATSILRSEPKKDPLVLDSSKQNILEKSNKVNKVAFNVNQDAYILGPGDLLELELFDVPNLSGDLDILSDGSITLPLVGTTYVAGLTVEQASQKIKNLMGKELLRPELQLKIKSSRPIRVSLVGEIERPGIYSLTSTEKTQTRGDLTIENRGLPTLIDAIRKGGGITQNGKLDEITLLRRIPSDKKEYKFTTINLLSLIKEGDQYVNPYLFDGDIIKIKKAEKLDLSTFELAYANLSPKEIKVTIIGEVENPGPILLNSATPLMEGILSAGGVTPLKANSNVRLIRIMRNGTISQKKYKINFANTRNVSDDTNPLLIDGDIIQVRTNKFGKATSTLDIVSKPAGNLLSIFTLVKILNGD